MNELLSHHLLCRIPICLTIQRYEISQYFEIGARQNWFTYRFLRQCSLWCSTDSCRHIFLLHSGYPFLSQLIRQLSIAFFELCRFWQLQISNTQTKYEILPARRKTPYYTTHRVANRYFELKYTFRHCWNIPITFKQGCTYIYIYMYLEVKLLVPRSWFNMSHVHLMSVMLNTLIWIIAYFDVTCIHSVLPTFYQRISMRYKQGIN